MFSDYENTVLMDKFPFDVQIYSSDVSDDFSDEIRVLRENTEILDLYSYHIYTDKGSQVNTWMLTNLTAWGTMYQNEDGTPDTAKIEEELKNGRNYCTYDTYMGISDYNYLRDMLGYQEISLSAEEYLVHTKSRISDEVQGIGDDLQIADASGNGTLICKGIFTEPFSQDGHNGGDYIIVVPDEVLTRMQPYYSELVADINGDAPMDLRTKLDELTDADDFYFGDRVDPALEGNSCTGSDNIITYSAVNLVKDNLIPEVKYMLASIIIPLFYIGMVFLCIAMTVLSVQQISDSAKYKFRYDVLKKLGLERTRIDALILKQLGAYYLCPALLAIVISGEMIQYMSKNFVIMTGVPVSSGAFFARSVLLFFGIYLVYFVVTYIEFKRNIEEKV
jgi:hypothetical protein